MSIIKTITDYSRLYHDLKSMDKNNFTYEGAWALMKYLDDLSDDIGEHIIYDPISFCCDYTEYETIGLIADDYNNAPQADDFDNPDEWEEKLLEWLNEQTVVIQFDEGLIIRQF